MTEAVEAPRVSQSNSWCCPLPPAKATDNPPWTRQLCCITRMAPGVVLGSILNAGVALYRKFSSFSFFGGQGWAHWEADFPGGPVIKNSPANSGDMVHHVFFIHSFIDRYSGCSHALATVNSTVVNTGVHVSC